MHPYRGTLNLFLSFAILTLSSVAGTNVSALRGRGLTLNKSKKGKVDICHYEKKRGKFNKISISQNDLKKHIGKHGPIGSGLQKDMTVAVANGNPALHSKNCVCELGYIGDGLNCADVDECAPGGTANCGANTDCTNTDGSFTCTCKDGYEFGTMTGCTDVRLTCANVNGMNWCYEKTPNADQSCNAVCGGADKVIADNMDWFVAQDTVGKCEAMRNALFPGNLIAVSVDFWFSACAGMWLGTLYCSNNDSCPYDHRTGFDSFDGFVSVCPCI